MSNAPRSAGSAVSRKMELLERILKQKGIQAPQANPIRRRGHTQPSPLSCAQRRLWFLDQLTPNTATYNNPIAMYLNGPLDVPVLEQVLNEVLRRHEVLRTTFTQGAPAVDQQPMQVVNPALKFVLPLFNLSELPEDEQAVQARWLCAQEAQRPFDLSRDLPLRSILIRLNAQRHVIVLVMHHIVSDAWSMSVLVEEIAALYNALAAGCSSPLSELDVQYADYAEWQQRWLQSDDYARQLAYWKQHLGGNLPVLELPTDRPRPKVQTFCGAKPMFTLPAHLLQPLRQLSRREGATLFMTVLAAFKVLLYRYTGQTDLLVGSPIANRTRDETEKLIGFFVNTLVLRSDLSGTPSFREVVQRIRQVCLQAFAHQDLPFEKLVEELHPERNLSHTPLFQVLFVLQNITAPPLRLADVSIEPVKVESTTAMFDLTFELIESPDSLNLRIEYNTDLFDAGTITRMVSHFQTLLEQIVADPDQSIQALPLMTTQEQRQLARWNMTAAPYPYETTLAQLFEAQAARSADRAALVFEDQTLTYDQLNRQANQLAQYLLRIGVGPERRVGISMERSVEQIVAVLAVLKAGGCYVPLDPHYPQERLAYMLADAQVAVLLTQAELVNLMPTDAQVAQVVCLDTVWPEIEQLPAHNLPATAYADSIAYITYTSGSTGKPKGIAMPQRSLLNLLHWHAQHAPLHPGARTIQFASLNFDVSFQDLFCTWCSGGTVVSIPDTVRQDLPGLAQALTARSIERIFIPAVALQQVAEGWSADHADASRLQKVIAGSEQLLITPAIGQMFAQLPDCVLSNEYGPSETHVVTALSLSGAPSEWPQRPTVGRPIANTQIYLLDPYGQPVPIGIPGELLIGGVSLARGYLNRPDLTAERFVPDPFSGIPGARLYRTGDLARYRADGNIEFLGRKDFQVKLRGFRVELGEIEAVLAQHPAVKETIVLAREDTPGNKRLVAYIVGEQANKRTKEQSTTDSPSPAAAGEGAGGEGLTTSLRTFLHAQLPEYMIPSAFVFLDALPLNRNGKVDRKALPTPTQARPELESAFVAPMTRTEELLATVWSEVLGVDQIGIYDNFFDLGGHSILATRLIFRLRDTFQIELPLRTLFETPTIAGMAYAIEVLQQPDSAGEQATLAALNLQAETALDDAITPGDLPMAAIAEPDAILLTGASGFIGAFLLHELLRTTRADVYCLVRAGDDAAAKQRIRKNLQRYALWSPADETRIMPLAGDLGKPTLGLPAATFHELAGRIDSIYHNGALVNYVYPYAALKAPNVLGSHEVLRLASTTRIKAVHFISTLGVFDSEYYLTRASVHEDDDLDHCEGLTLGYAQSKWVAEKLMFAARARGLPVSVYRLGRISGHSATGACQTDDFFWRMVRACIKLGIVPELDVSVNVAPVEFICSTISHLSRQPEWIGQTFHLINPECAPLNELVGWMRASGYQLTGLPYEEWRTRLSTTAATSTEIGMYSLLLGRISEDQTEMDVDFSNMTAGLSGTSITCPQLDDALLKTYFTYFIGTGFLPAPSSAAEVAAA